MGGLAVFTVKALVNQFLKYFQIIDLQYFTSK